MQPLAAMLGRMAFTQAQLDAMEAAIASGTRRVNVNGREIEYRSMGDLIAAYNLVKRQVEAATKPSLRRGRYNPYYES